MLPEEVLPGSPDCPDDLTGIGPLYPAPRKALFFPGLAP